MVKIRPISRGLPGQQGVFHSWSKLDLDKAREPEPRLRAGAELCQGRSTPRQLARSACVQNPPRQPPAWGVSKTESRQLASSGVSKDLGVSKNGSTNWPVRVRPKSCLGGTAPAPSPAHRPTGRSAGPNSTSPKAHPANWRAPGAARTHLSPAGDRPSPPRRLASPPDGATRAPWGPPVHRPPPSARRCRGP